MCLRHWTVPNGILNTVNQPLSQIFRELLNVDMVGDCCVVAWGYKKIEGKTILLTSLSFLRWTSGYVYFRSYQNKHTCTGLIKCSKNLLCDLLNATRSAKWVKWRTVERVIWVWFHTGARIFSHPWHVRIYMGPHITGGKPAGFCIITLCLVRTCGTQRASFHIRVHSVVFWHRCVSSLRSWVE